MDDFEFLRVVHGIIPLGFAAQNKDGGSLKEKDSSDRYMKYRIAKEKTKQNKIEQGS